MPHRVYRRSHFFLMIRRPPRSPLFPSTTLFRSVLRVARPFVGAIHEIQTEWPPGLPARSEEHTSELQSHHELVCPLLLSKQRSGSTKNPRAGKINRSYCVSSQSRVG